MPYDIAVAHSTTPFISAYPWTAGTGFGAKYSNPATLPAGTGNGVAFTSAGTDIAVAHNTTPFISAYPWTAGTGFGAKYSNPATLPAGTGIGVAFTSAGTDIAVAHVTTPFISAYPWTAGTGFGAKYSDPATLPAGTGNGVAFTSAGTDIAVAHPTTPFISAYPWTAGTGFGAKYSNPATLPAGTGIDVAFTSAGTDIAVAHVTTPFISAYPWTAGTGFGAKYSDPATLPAGDCIGVDFDFTRATKFLESGTSATNGFEFWQSNTAGTTSDTAVIHNLQPRSIKATSTFGTVNVNVTSPSSILADAGCSISFYVNFTSFETITEIPNCWIQTSGAVNIFSLATTSSGVLQLRTGAAGGAQLDSNGSTLVTGTWYKITISYTITSTTVFNIKVFVNGVSDITATSGTLGTTVSSQFSLGWQGNGPGVGVATGGNIVNFSDIYVDDSAVADVGNINVTAKLPASNNVNNFDTEIGSSANRWDDVDERPLSEAKGWQQAGTSVVAENYGLQTAANGDADLSTAQLRSRSAWIWAKRGAPTAYFSYSSTQQGKGGAAATTLVFAAVTTAVGDVVVVTFSDQVDGTAPTIADNFTNTWTALTGGTNTVRMSTWYAVIASGKSGSMTVTITFQSSANSRAGCLAGFVNMTATPLDKNPAATNDSTSPYDGPSSGTLTQADELVIGYCAMAGPNGDTTGTTTEDALITLATTGGQAGSNSRAALTYRAVNATTAVVPEMTNTTADRAGITGTATFKASVVIAPIGNGSPKLTDNGVDFAVTLTTTSALFTVITDSTSYPSNADGIGMKSTGTTADTFFYEGGTLIAYIPSDGGEPRPPQVSSPHRLLLLGIGH